MLTCRLVGAPEGIEWITAKVATDTGHGGGVYSLLAVGGFRAEVGKQFTSVRDNWLSKHPKASLTSVCKYNDEGSKSLALSFVWISDGHDNLNVELVRQGCVSGDYMHVPKGQKLEVPLHEYQRFVENVRVAERKAKSERLGIWRIPTTSKSETGDD